jgi:hypothetical protein
MMVKILGMMVKVVASAKMAKQKFGLAGNAVTVCLYKRNANRADCRTQI